MIRPRTPSPDPVTAVLFAGGKGTRLLSVTEGRIPKSFVPIDEQSGLRVIDHILEALVHCDVQDIVISTTKALRSTFEPFENDRVSVDSDRRDEDGTYDALLGIAARRKDISRYLLLAQDNLFHKDDLLKLRHSHVPGNVTWAVAQAVPGMENYAGLHVDELSGDIIGDTQSGIVPFFSAQSVRDCTRSNIVLMDANLLADHAPSFVPPAHKPETDVYWDFLPHLLARSNDGMRSGTPAFVKASRCAYPVVDFGRPARLATARDIYTRYYQASSPSPSFPC